MTGSANAKQSAPAGRANGSDLRFIVVDAGNTSTTIGIWHTMRIEGQRRVDTADDAAFGEALGELLAQFDGKPPACVAVCSVVPDRIDALCQIVAGKTAAPIKVIGRDLPLPIDVAVLEPDRVGVDRVCAAAAAHAGTGHACTVVDFGTAVTVDLVDDAGVFLGGAIFPGIGLQARSLHTGTAALPHVEIRAADRAVGRDTAEAIRSGLYFGIAGAVRAIVEQYATELQQWPQVVATGGNLDLFLPGCDFIDSPVPTLTLMGVGLAFARHAVAKTN